MSFNDAKQSIEQFSITPWNAFRQKSLDLNTIHNDCVNQFAKVMGDLLTGSDGEPAFQGPAADTLAKMVGDFLDGESRLSGSSDDPFAQIGLQPDLAAACEKWAKQLEQKLGDIATQPVILENMMSGTVMVVGAGAASQGFLDIPWDVFALLLIAFVATFTISPVDVHDGFRIKTQEEVADEVREKAAWQADNDDINSFDSDTTDVQNNNPSPKLPPDPQADPNAFLKAMGLAAGVGGLIAIGATIIWNLSPDQEGLAQRLYADYGSSGLSLEDFRSLVGDNPNLTEAQWRELFARYGQVIAANPNLVKKYGALAVFNEFVALSAYNAAQGGNYSTRKPVRHLTDIDEGMVEAEAQLGAMEEGKVDWPLTPSTNASYESTDPNGQTWDVKKGYPTNPYGKPYDPVDTVDKLQKKDFAKGEKVIFDDSLLSQKEIDATYEELKRRGLEKDVVWWPTQPN